MKEINYYFTVARKNLLTRNFIVCSTRVLLAKKGFVDKVIKIDVKPVFPFGKQESSSSSTEETCNCQIYPRDAHCQRGKGSETYLSARNDL